jgi:hypothetical protein
METSTFHVDSTAEPVAEMDRLGDEIAELSAHLAAITAHLLTLIREFDARGGWNRGFRSCAYWLAWRVEMNLGAARERVRVARALGALPRLAGALACGELSYAKVRAITRVATPETEERLLAIGKAGTACQVERIVRGWRRVDTLAEARETARLHKSRALHMHEDEDGMIVIRGRLTPEAGAVLKQALAAARDAISASARRGRQRARRSRGNAVDGSATGRWPCWPRPRSIAASTPARRANATRSSSTSMPRCSRTPRRPGSPCSTAARTSPRKPPGVSRVTRAGW